MTVERELGIKVVLEVRNWSWIMSDSSWCDLSLRCISCMKMTGDEVQSSSQIMSDSSPVVFMWSLPALYLLYEDEWRRVRNNVMTMPFVYVQGAINSCWENVQHRHFLNSINYSFPQLKLLKKKQLIYSREQWNQAWSRTDLCLQNLKTCCFCKNSTNGHDPWRYYISVILVSVRLSRVSL